MFGSAWTSGLSGRSLSSAGPSDFSGRSPGPWGRWAPARKPDPAIDLAFDALTSRTRGVKVAVAGRVGNPLDAGVGLAYRRV